MKYFDLNGEKISRLGFGCMRFKTIDGDNGKIDKKASSKDILEAIDNGLTYIDTAYPYHDGKSEKFIGEFLEENKLRDKIKLTTKLPCWLVKERGDFYKLLNEQLENLRTDHLDFYLLHSLDVKRFRQVVELGVLDFLTEIKEKGIVKHVGFSFHDEYPAFEEIIKAYDWDFCQIQLNYLDVDYQAGLKGYELAKEMGIPVVIMEPVKGGRLANPPEELRNMLKDFTDLSPAQEALKFPLSLDNVMTVLSGMNDIDQVRENLEMASTTDYNSLAKEDEDFYEKARAIYKSRERIGCTACEYCLPCTVDINIPKVFGLWNKAYLYDEADKSRKEYKDYLEEGVSPTECIECGKCEGICPQNLEIIKGLKEADEYLA
ncbi:putative oxidoreductase [Anaerococcus prevotii]|uniref:Aldo/keto reductase n=1 Tax=Anaerococcus prevotii (strain ATCC 9321 / DSM 20548 / JCM 6508 / NCTC 11806 / PC1) TaxID=525919 RepID=C7RG84_ANAPD|nr:aldo/keto reductase [Anaerococcus prevotii]ACV28495.1 aldo/keto reductase [Anaerococcus prevotii DSM 20548]SUU94054.1 putative oxidoreductase [Anaerococcus prevotii]